MAAKLYNLARMNTATTGTGTITLSAAISGFLSFADAGVSDAEEIYYTIRDGSNSEVGTGVYTASGTTLTRVVEKSTNTDAAISLSGGAEVMISPTAVQLTTLDAGSVDTAELADDSVTFGKLLNATQASVMGADAAGAFKELTAGDNITLSGGTISAGGGALVHLGTLTASASATLEDTTSITGAYDNYLFIFEDIHPATDSVQFRARLSTDGGSTYASTNYNGVNKRFLFTTGPVTSTAEMNLSYTTTGNDASYGSYAQLMLSNVNNASRYKAWYGYNLGVSTSATVEGVYFAGWYESTSVVDAIQFYYSSGNITGGSVHIYGVATS